MLDLVFKGEDLGRGGIAAIDDGQGVLARNTDVAEAVASGESGFLDQPGCGDFVAWRLWGPQPVCSLKVAALCVRKRCPTKPMRMRVLLRTVC